MHYHLLSLFLLILACGCSNDNTIRTHSDSLSVAITEDPVSLDPRIVRDLQSSSVMRMLYEGLMRPSLDGEIIPAVAEKYFISNDKKTYTFNLRESTWSDGTPLTAEDFAQSWISVLSPNFPAPNAYQLYLIKGAKAAKEGHSPLSEVGIKVSNPYTLIVELEKPTPYFLEMLSCHFYYPVHESLRENPENNASSNIVNGPFVLDSWKKRSELNLKKNSHYWDEKNVNLEGIALQVLDEHTALQLFKAGKLDWAGSPLSTLPQDAITSLKQQKALHITPGAGTHWFRLNTSKAPFNNEKMRRAFALALDRQAIVEHVTQGNQQPAIGILPPSLAPAQQNFYTDHDKGGALKLFNEVLTDSKTKITSLPVITLSYASNDRNHKIAQAVQQQWNQVFGLEVVLHGAEPQMHLERVRNGNYEIGMGSWYADIHDPINFLEIFKTKDNAANQTFWEDSNFSALLETSSVEEDQVQRNLIFQRAENILINGMPVVPLFHSSYNYVQSDRVKDVYISPLGFLDFKNASLLKAKD